MYRKARKQLRGGLILIGHQKMTEGYSDMGIIRVDIKKIEMDKFVLEIIFINLLVCLFFQH